MTHPPTTLPQVNLRNLSVGGYGQGLSFYFYATEHTRRDLEGLTYWRDARDHIKDGDFIFVKHEGDAPGSSIYSMWHTPRGLRAIPLTSTFGSGQL